MTAARPGRPLNRCDDCAHVRHHLCAGLDHCSCWQCHGREIERRAEAALDGQNPQQIRLALNRMTDVARQKRLWRSQRQGGAPKPGGLCECGCGERVVNHPHGRRRRFISKAHWQRAYRARIKAWFAEHPEDVVQRPVEVVLQPDVEVPKRSHHSQQAPVEDSQWSDIDPAMPHPPRRPHPLDGPEAWAAWREWVAEHGEPATPGHDDAPATRPPPSQAVIDHARMAARVQQGMRPKCSGTGGGHRFQ